MLKIFTGEDRVRATNAIASFLGKDYEIIDAIDLTPSDLPSIFLGGSLFADTRNILIRDLSANKVVFDKLPDYLDTPHNVVLLELKLDKRSATYKAIKDKVEIKDFPLPRDPNQGLVFDIYRTAKRDGKKAIADLARIESTQDPIMFFGLMVSQAVKDYAAHQGIKEKRALRELSKLDLELKSTSYQPWLLIRAFLLRASSL